MNEDERMFEQITGQLQAYGLMVKQGTIVDIKGFYPSVVVYMLLMFIPGPELLYSQTAGSTVLSGVVTEKETAHPLVGVHVYVDNTMSGATTDTTGRYHFEVNLTGFHVLVFSFIGYKTETVVMNLNDDTNEQRFDVELDPATFELHEIVVTDSWQHDFDEFRKLFVGVTSFAKETEITNPAVLSFERDAADRLTAMASEPISVKNEALGYFIHVDLIDFLWKKDEGDVFFTGRMKFEEMEIELPEDSTKWARNRDGTYTGSFKYFLQNLFNGNLIKYQFGRGQTDGTIPTNLRRLTDDELHLWLTSQAIEPSSIRMQLKGYILTERIDIQYRCRPRGLVERLLGRRCRSALIPVSEDDIFIVTDRGTLLDPLSLKLVGHWSNHRLANMLPYDY